MIGVDSRWGLHKSSLCLSRPACSCDEWVRFQLGMGPVGSVSFEAHAR